MYTNLRILVSIYLNRGIQKHRQIRKSLTDRHQESIEDVYEYKLAKYFVQRVSHEFFIHTKLHREKALNFTQKHAGKYRDR